MEKNSEKIEQVFILENKRKLSITGVSSVDGYGSQFIKITVNGEKVIISGDNIKISAFNKANGNLSADGNFSEIKFLGSSLPLLKRIFK